MFPKGSRDIHGIFQLLKTGSRCGCAAFMTAMYIQSRLRSHFVKPWRKSSNAMVTTWLNYKLEGHPLRWFEAKSDFLRTGCCWSETQQVWTRCSVKGSALPWGTEVGGQCDPERIRPPGFFVSGITGTRSIMRSEMGKSLAQAHLVGKGFTTVCAGGAFQRMVWRHMGASSSGSCSTT